MGELPPITTLGSTPKSNAQPSPQDADSLPWEQTVHKKVPWQGHTAENKPASTEVVQELLGQ